jgi:uncharacterized membrane protein YfcA
VIFLLLLGLGVGAVSALLGIGGGVFLVPFLPALTGWNEHQVVAFALLIIMGNSLANLYWFNKRGLVSWDVLIYWGPMAAVGSFLGSYYSISFPGRYLRIALLAIVVLMIIRFTLQFFQRSENKLLFTSSDWSPFKSIYGIFVGTLSGFCGVGTGLVSNMMFMGRRWVLKDRVAPTGNGVMFFVSMSSFVSFILFGGGRDVSFNFIQDSWLEALILMISVFFSSFLFRPLNPLISDGLRYMGLFVSLCFVSGYILYTL